MSTVQEETKQNKKGGRAVGRIVLVVSLALNLFLLGFLGGGGHWRHQGAGPGAEMSTLLGGSPREFGRFLSSHESRSKLHDALSANRKDIAPAMGQSFAARKHIMDAIKADPFETSDLAKAFEDSRKADDLLRRATQKTTTEFIASLSPAERKELVAAMRQAMKRGWWRNRPGRHGPPPEGMRHKGPDENSMKPPALLSPLGFLFGFEE